MNRTRVLVMGGSGMLGSMVVDCFSRIDALEVTSTVRTSAKADEFGRLYPRARWVVADYSMDVDAALAALDGQQWIVNAIGVTKPFIKDDIADQVRTAIQVNALLPDRIASYAERCGARVLQIATDCVYSGAKGSYREEDPHDALDVYGKTKSLGETRLPATHHLRCSIIGPEPQGFNYLLEWFRRQPRGAAVNGFVNHRWNGVTTLHFARLCAGIIQSEQAPGRMQHIIPSGSISKAEMLKVMAEAYSRSDIEIRDVEANSTVDRTLDTSSPAANAAIWRLAGYDPPPTVPQMLRELADYPYAPDKDRK